MIVVKLKCLFVVYLCGVFCECVEMIDVSGVDWMKVVFYCFMEGEVEMVEFIWCGGYGLFMGIFMYKIVENICVVVKV